MRRIAIKKCTLSIWFAPLTTSANVSFIHHDVALYKHMKCKITASFFEKKLFLSKNLSITAFAPFTDYDNMWSE